MSKFSNTKPRKGHPPEPPKPEEAPDLALTAETFTALQVQPEPEPAAPVEEPKKSGRPPGVPRKIISMRLKPETIVEAEALKVGLKLKSQGEAFERAISFFTAHIIAKTRQELRLAPEVDDEAVLLKAFKADD